MLYGKRHYWREDGQPLLRSTAPGVKFGYSGEGFGYLQQVIEQINGQSLGEFMHQTAFVPLGMPQSTYAWTVPNEINIASGHDDEGTLLLPFSMAGPHAAASLQTTPSEYARFMCAMFDPETAPCSLGRAYRAEMLRPQVELEPAIAWGLGWALQYTKDGWAFWHSGDNPGFKHLALAYPHARIGLVIMTNSNRGTSLWEPPDRGPAIGSQFVAHRKSRQRSSDQRRAVAHHPNDAC